MGWFSSFFIEDFDIPIDTISKDGSVETPPKPVGIDGIKAMLSHDPIGGPSPQLTIIKEVTFMGGFYAALFGGVTHAQDAYIRFLRTNQATPFENPHTARRLMYDRVMIGFCKGAWMHSWRIMVFSSSFLFISCAIPAYRGKHSIFDLTAGSAMAGMLYKFKHGPKPMVAGALLGALLGTQASLLAAGLLSLAGLTLDDIYDMKRQATIRSLQARHQRIEKLREDKLTSPSDIKS
ncbi:RPII140-upstream gene protein [Hyalella azteca]|uniref:Complex I assembly factor TIMMDC1, mitochondrial n=1 Tax=Hyalella azteca TaxID=294128 RepID=A0A8B7N7Q0_HYAAZ|nr:RPII140-upstream gene protein [Hyalella azteca]